MQDLKERWFKNHKAEQHLFYDGDRVITQIVWKAPDTVVNSIYYFIWGATLMVCGDLGEAIYRWSGGINLKFLAGCNQDYFREKCCGLSGQPEEVYSWDEDACRAEVESILVEPNGWWDGELLVAKRKVFEEENGKSFMASQDEWAGWLRCHEDEFIKGWWDGPASWGRVTNIRVLGHLVGLKMAWEQLGEDKNVSKAAP